MSSQLVLYNFCLNSSIDSVSNAFLHIKVFFVLFVCFVEDRIMTLIEK